MTSTHGVRSGRRSEEPVVPPPPTHSDHPSPPTLGGASIRCMIGAFCAYDPVVELSSVSILRERGGASVVQVCVVMFYYGAYILSVIMPKINLAILTAHGKMLQERSYKCIRDHSP